MIELKIGDWYFLRGCLSLPVGSLRYDGCERRGVRDFELFSARDGTVFAVEKGSSEVYERDSIESGRTFFGKAVIKEVQPIGGDFRKRKKGRRGSHGESVYRSFHDLPLFGRNESK